MKKRLARAGEGKRGGYRTIIVYRKSARAVFLYGFAKSDQENLDPDELREYQKLGQLYLRFGETDLVKAIRGGELWEVKEHDEKISQ